MEQLRRPVVFAMIGLLGLILFKIITKSSYHGTAIVSLIFWVLIFIIQIKWSFKYNLNDIKKISNHSSMFFNYINCIFTSIKSFTQFITLKRLFCLLTGSFTMYVGYRFFTIQNFNDIKELQNILVLLMTGYPIGIFFKTLFFQLSHEQDIKKLRSMSYEELLSAKGRKYYLLNRKAFEHVIREFYK